MKKILFILLMLLAAPASVLAEDEPMARIITGNERVTQCLSSVHIRQVDGKQKQLPSQGFDLTPGKHSLHGTAKLNTTYCRMLGAQSRSSVPALEAEFEAGKTYYIGLDHSSSKSEEWRLVIWKVEEGTG